MFHGKKFDFYLFFPIIFLLAIGTVTIASVTPENLSSHLFYVMVSLIFFFIFSIFDLDLFFPFSPIIYVASLLFLIVPFLVGTATRGSIRWIPIGNYTIQPSEIVKPFLALTAAWFWSKEKFSFKNLGKFFLLFLPALSLVFFQPDLGSTLVILSILIGMVFLSGIRLKQLLILFLATILVIPFFWFSLRSYQKMRIVHFINPYSDPLGEGYNLIQAKIAIGSGGLFGKGLGRGTQSHLAFLPERHTDFIFASLSEEMGFVGAFLVLMMYLFLFLRILKIASHCQDKTMSLLAFGLLFSLFFQMTVNVGMNIGLLPIAGVTLPLVSYGGSSLLSTMISLGIIEGISRQRSIEKVIEIK